MVQGPPHRTGRPLTMRNWFHSIGARIFAGFGLFIAALAVFFVLTAWTTKTQSRLLEEAVALDIAKADVAKLLQSVEAMRAYSFGGQAARADRVSHVDAHQSLDQHQAGFAAKLSELQSQSPEQEALHQQLYRHHLATDALLDHLQGLVPPGTRKTDFDADFDTMVRVDEILDNPFDPGEDPEIPPRLRRSWAAGLGTTSSRPSGSPTTRWSPADADWMPSSGGFRCSCCSPASASPRV